jgi:DNA-binding transcriptional MerR regulator
MARHERQRTDRRPHARSGSRATPDPDSSRAEVADGTDGDRSEEFTLDELAAHTGVSGRTIRYYQSKGTLPAPERRGRVAVYSALHVQRLELIADLQARGLRLDAIRDLLREMEHGRDSLNEWLGLGDHLQAAWVDDRPAVFDEDELAATLAPARSLFRAEAERAGLLRRQGNSLPPTYLVPSPRLLELTVRLDAAGIDVDTAVGAATIVRKRMSKVTDELVEWFAEHIGQGFGGSGDPDGVTRSMEVLRPAGIEAVGLIFAQEMERSLRRFVESGRVMEHPKRERTRHAR